MSASLPIRRPGPDEHASYYGAYVVRVPGDDALAVLASQLDEPARSLLALPEHRALHRYAPGKWSVKEVVGHLCDSERVFAYRALRFARSDATALAGFDENLYVPAGRFDARPMSDLVDEFRALRLATLALYRGLDEAALSRRGVANGVEISVRALAFVIAGHASHHFDVLRGRYGIG